MSFINDVTDEGGIEIEVPLHDISSTESGLPPNKEAPPDPGATELRSQVEKLTRQRDENQRRADAEARARADAETRAREAAREAEAARTGSQDVQRVSIENAISATEASIKAAKKTLSGLWAEGKFDEAADTQEEIAIAAAELAQLKAGKAALPATGTETTVGRVEVRKPEPARPTQDQEFETRISQYSPRAQQWLREHRDAITDPVVNARLIRAHHVAVDQGLHSGEARGEETDAYFDFLSQKLGYTNGGEQPPQRAHEEARPVPRQQQTQPPRQRSAAPVRGSDSGSGRASGGGESVRVKLTEGERSAALDGTHVWDYDNQRPGAKKGDPIGITEMARRKALIEAGKAGNLQYKYGEA